METRHQGTYTDGCYAGRSSHCGILCGNQAQDGFVCQNCVDSAPDLFAATATIPMMGLGIFAVESIVPQQYIGEYDGARHLSTTTSGKTAIKRILEKPGHHYLASLEKGWVINAAKSTSMCRYMNHSCSPNCRAVVIEVDEQMKLVLVSTCAITANTELTWDYKLEKLSPQYADIPCLCGELQCRRYINVDHRRDDVAVFVPFDCL